MPTRNAAAWGERVALEVHASLGAARRRAVRRADTASSHEDGLDQLAQWAKLMDAARV